MIQKAVEAVLCLFLVGLVGYVLDKRGWFGAETRAMLPRLVTTITIPLYLMTSVVAMFGRDELIHLAYGAVIPAISFVIVFLISQALSRFMVKPEGRRGIFRAGFVISSTIFTGIPVNVALFGDASLPYALLYFLPATAFYWTVGNFVMSRDGGGPHQPIFSRDTVKRVVSPPILGFGAGLALILLDCRPPDFIMQAAKLVGGMTTPLAVIYIGITLAETDFSAFKFDCDVGMVLVGRFLICPAVTVALVWAAGLPTLMAKVFIIQSALPVVNSVALVAGRYGADAEYASLIVSVTTLVSLATIPLTVLALDFLPI